MAVSYLKEKKNEQWNNFWESVAQQQRKNQQIPFTEYFNRAFQTTFYNFHKEYAGYIKHLRYQYLFWSINALLALLLPVILIIAWRIRKKRLSALPDLPLPEDDETEI